MELRTFLYPEGLAALLARHDEVTNAVQIRVRDASGSAIMIDWASGDKEKLGEVIAALQMIFDALPDPLPK